LPKVSPPEGWMPENTRGVNWVWVIEWNSRLEKSALVAYP
jgi:hypothetical protein